MAAAHGKLPEFKPEGGNFEVFLERFETYAEANDITGDQKRALFLSALPEEVYSKLRALIFPKTPRQASFEEVSSALKNHYSPRRSVVSARYRFNQRMQQPSETITDFIIAMRQIALHCEFGGFLQDALRDRLIVGLRNGTIRDRLLAMPDEEASWEQACNLAKEMEAAGEENAKYVRPLISPARPSTSTANIAAPQSETSVKVETPTASKPKVPMTMPDGTKQTTEQGGARSDTSVKVETPTASKPKVPMTMLHGTKQTVEPRGKHQLSASVPDTPLHGKKPRLSVPEDASHSSKKDVHDQKGIAFDQRNSTYNPTDSSFTCQFCGKNCSAQDKLEAHVRTHTGERPFKCPFCKEKFGHPNSLRKHRNERHPKNWKWYCEECKSGYDTYEQLIKHIDSSTDEDHKSLERPRYLKCPFCKEKFGHPSSLRKHRNESHPKDWKFYCKTCKRGYDTYRQLRKHVATHSSSDISTDGHRKALKRPRSWSEDPLDDDSSHNDESFSDDDSNDSNDGDSNDDDSKDDHSDDSNSSFIVPRKRILVCLDDDSND